MISFLGCSQQLGLAVVGDDEKVVNISDRSLPHSETFLLRNGGETPETITRIQTGCTCTSGYLEGDAVVRSLPKTVLPGEEVPIVVKIKSFSPDARDFAEYAIVATTAQRLRLRVRGTLPAPTNVLYRPHIVVLDPTLGEQLVTLTFRIPELQTAVLTDKSIQFPNLAAFAPQVQTMKNARSGGYIEYEIPIKFTKADKMDFATGEIEIKIDQSPPIRIPVVPKIQ